MADRVLARLEPWRHHRRVDECVWVTGVSLDERPWTPAVNRVRWAHRRAYPPALALGWVSPAAMTMGHPPDGRDRLHADPTFFGLLPTSDRPRTARFRAALAAAARAAARWMGRQPAGVRVWWVEPVDTHLISATWIGDWDGTTVDAGCSYGGTPPCSDHPCGLYAVHPRAVCLLADMAWAPAVGVVSLSGRIVEHKHGWRAERARIREVWVRSECLDDVDRSLYPGVTWWTF